MTGLTPDPQRQFGRRARVGRTLTVRGWLMLALAALIALACARLFGAPSHF